jgi:hypothetical protein
MAGQLVDLIPRLTLQFQRYHLKRPEHDDSLVSIVRIEGIDTATEDRERRALDLKAIQLIALAEHKAVVDPPNNPKLYEFGTIARSEGVPTTAIKAKPNSLLGSERARKGTRDDHEGQEGYKNP